MRYLWLLAPLALAACMEQEPPTGAEDFASFCAACHGPGGKGDGPTAAELGRKPADLTRLALANGGAFPATAVMAKIWGYTGVAPGRADSASPMPELGPLLAGDLVPYDGGDGIRTPTPIRLVQLAEHVRSLQK